MNSQSNRMPSQEENRGPAREKKSEQLLEQDGEHWTGTIQRWRTFGERVLSCSGVVVSEDVYDNIL